MIPAWLETDRTERTEDSGKAIPQPFKESLLTKIPEDPLDLGRARQIFFELDQGPTDIIIDVCIPGPPDEQAKIKEERMRARDSRSKRRHYCSPQGVKVPLQEEPNLAKP